MWMKHNNYVIPKIYMVFGWIVENDAFIDENKVAAIFLNFSGALDSLLLKIVANHEM